MSAYVNRRGQSFSDGLVQLARLSPRAYADQIRDRNQALLKALDLLIAAGNYGLEQVARGCPHCRHGASGFQCMCCLWPKAFGVENYVDTRLHCTRMPFPSGWCLNDVTHLGDCWITYSSDSCEVAWGPDADADQVSMVRQFLEDHVDWAELPCWGEACAEDKHEEDGDADSDVHEP